MFNARNLNNLYSRFDQKCARVLDNKTPVVAELSSDNYLPLGVRYLYSRDPDTAFYISSNSTPQSEVEVELSKLEVKHLDVAGGQVYLDKYIPAVDPFTCNLEAIQKSFALHRRLVDGVEYDVHIGWDSDDATLTSYARQYFSDLGVTPTLPPGRIHKHKIAVADILIEGLGEFRVLNTYQRFDCWRVHNCGSNTLTVYLQNADGSSQRESVAPMGCRAFRRRADGSWATTWPDGSFCTYFFPYFKGDVPYFAGGPPLYDYSGGSINFLENSAQANNIANPFLLTQWMRCLNAWLDPFIPLDIRQTYPDVFGDPENANTPIGDLIFTWGRARVTVIKNNLIVEDYFKVFRGTTSFLEDLDSIGVNVTFDGLDLTVSTKLGDSYIRIWPLDANVFALGGGWEIYPTPSTISTVYPDSYFRPDVAAPYSQSNWTAGNEPSWFETVRTLRRRIAVEEGFINNYDDVDDISEEKVGHLALTPLGIVGRASTSFGIETFNATAFSDIPSYERNANISDLRTEWRPSGFGSGSYANFPYVSAVRTYFLQSVNYAPLGYVFPQIQTQALSHQAIQCVYIPPGGPWGFSSAVFDDNLSRCYTTNPAVPVVSGMYGSDFWINKWGGPAGIDASVRILGQPNKTVQNGGDVVDVYRPLDNPQMAYLLESTPAYQTSDFSEISKIVYLSTTWFEFDVTPVLNELGVAAPVYHKIPKSAWLWNLLEYQVRAWTRAVPLCHGEVIAPIYAFNGAGVLQPAVMEDLIPAFSLTCIDDGYPSFRIDESTYNSLIANGIQAREFYAGAPFNHYYYSVRAMDLAAYCGSKGFNSYNFDCTNAELDADNGTVTAATTWIPLRAYGPGETVQMASFYDEANSKQLYRAIRYVDLRLPNELSA
jgi:hypothetical protein